MLVPLFDVTENPSYSLGDIYQGLYHFFGKNVSRVDIYDEPMDLPIVNGQPTITRKYIKTTTKNAEETAKICKEKKIQVLVERYTKYPCPIGIWKGKWIFTNATDEHLGLRAVKSLYFEFGV